MESWTYDAQDRLTSHTPPERTTTWQLDAGGRRIQQTVVATAGATGPPVNANPLEASAGAPLGTLTYSYNSRDQLTQISGAQSASYTYDAAGKRLSQSLTRSGTTQTTRYRWNAQDQLVQVEQGSGSNPPELLASYRYSADNLRAEKQLSDLGQANASQASAPSASPLAYERTQWDGLHARRSFEITGSNNTQTLRSDTDAAVLAGNTAPWLFSRTEYTNGLGSSSRTTQLHADSQGTLIATVVSESGAAKADSLLHYSAYGLIDSEASGNAGTGLRSNGHSFGSYYADPETGLLYARARYFDPASGQFVSRDPEEGEANLPITWGAYQYARYSPYRYNDPNGKVSVSTMIDNAAEGCGAISCGMYALGKGLYTVATLGFASVHDPVKDAYDEGKVSEKRYWVAGFGGGLAVAALNVVTGAASGAAVGAVSSTAGRMAVAAAMGAGSAAAGDAATQGAHMGAGIQENYNPTQTAIAAGVGGVVGAGSVPLGQAIKSSLDRREVAKALAKELQNSEPVLAAKTPSVGPEQVRPVVKDTTGTIVTEGPKLQAAGELQPQVVSARAGPSEVVSPAKSNVANSGRDALIAESRAQSAYLQSKYGGLSSAERMGRLDELAEANAYRRLQELESSIPGAHFLEKHGAQTTLQSQLERVQFGKNPTTGVIEKYANGNPKIPSSATRFLSNRDQLNAIDRAQNIYRMKGDQLLAEQPISFNYLIGEGYKKTSLAYGQSYSVQVWFRNGQVNTAFPIWGQ